ncbi:hypothetical protein [Antrihabitans spumae]|uniref:Uncharacterized protein n=1 Tax=Antrihabitans spumae TaxID=3373370 RepID=A0ABW7K2J1_9NOCA
MSGRSSPLRRKSKAAGTYAEVGKRPEEGGERGRPRADLAAPEATVLCDNVNRLQKSLVAITPAAINDAVLAAATTGSRARA